MKASAIFLCAMILCSVTAYPQSSDFRTGKGLETMYSVLRELNASYVDSIDNEKLINIGIDAMLESLDPYTEFIRSEDDGELQMLVSKTYGGIGSIIRKVDSTGVMITSPYENSAAANAGLEPGDVILSIDGEKTAGLTVSQCSEKMRGIPGTDVRFRVRKGRSGEEKEITVTRERIRIPDIACCTMFRDSIGYIKVSGFAQGCAADFRRSLERLEASGRMKALVVDLRGNGGGAIEEAVGIVSCFVPYGTKVVESRGRDMATSGTYFTAESPVDTEIPLAVMINSVSASASEIVAGALQDMDRAVVGGVKSFGKGLVQTLREDLYGNRLKFTTAKYYIPSGRCVQAIDYASRDKEGSPVHIADSLRKEFRTAGGRIVRDGGGIEPDVEAKESYLSRVAASLVLNDIVGGYAVEYYLRNPEIDTPETFTLGEDDYMEFVEYACGKDFDFRTAAAVEVDLLKEALKNENLDKDFEEEVKYLEEKFILDKREVLLLQKEEISRLLEQEIVSKYYYEDGRVRSFLRHDGQLHEILDLIYERGSENILRPDTAVR